MVFQNIDDDDINYVQNFIKTTLFGLLVKKCTADYEEDCEVVVDESQMTDHFGCFYADKPQEFSFNRGERKYIKELVAHVHKTVEKKGLVYFKYKQPLQNKSNIVDRPSEINRESNLMGSSIRTKKIPDILSRYSVDALKTKLFEKMVECLKFYEAGTENVTENLARVNIKGDSIIGELSCVLCKRKTNSKPIRVYYQQKQNSEFWVLSNFQKHLKRIHSKTDSDNLAKDSTSIILNKIVEKSQKQDTLATETECDAECDKREVTVFENCSSLLKKNMDESVCDNTGLHLYEQISSQITKMHETVLTKNEKLEEMQFILNEDENSSLKVTKVEPDGNCLFSALAHQLFYEELNSTEHLKSTSKLRDDVVAYIKSNFESFENDLAGRIYDIKSANEITNMKSECNFFLKFCLPRNGFWGGSETIKAVAELYKTNVFVFNEKDKVYVLYNEINERSVAVAYRIGKQMDQKIVRNHYDSVCSLNPNQMYAITKNEMQKRNSNEIILINDTL